MRMPEARGRLLQGSSPCRALSQGISPALSLYPCCRCPSGSELLLFAVGEGSAFDENGVDVAGRDSGEVDRFLCFSFDAELSNRSDTVAECAVDGRLSGVVGDAGPG